MRKVVRCGGWIKPERKKKERMRASKRLGLREL